MSNSQTTNIYQLNAKIMCCSTDVDTSELDNQLFNKYKIHSNSCDDLSKLLTMLQVQRYDLLVIFNIPTPEIIRELRENFSAALLPIIVCQEHKDPQLRNSILELGISDYICGTTDSTEIALRIQGKLNEIKVYKAELAHYAADKKDLSEQLEILIANGLMLSVEHDRFRLLQHILETSQSLLNCAAGTLFLLTEQNTLQFNLRTRKDVLPILEIPLYDPATGKPNEKYVCTYSALNRKTVIIDDIERDNRFDFSGTRNFHSESDFKAVSMLSIPIAPRDGDVIGVLQFVNAKDPDTDQIIPFRRDLIMLVEAFAAQAAVALDNLKLVEEQKQLMESMIRVIAAAIDAKSLYTGRHCERVPELAMMLAREVCAIESGPLADFNFESQDEWQEFRFGAWLHDCGKVTTPEYVIDKATKLETIYNRIHEVRMRFEVLLRDAQIAALQAQLDGTPAEVAQAQFEQRQQKLVDDFAFLAECNVGSEAMHPESIQRIQQIAQQTWLRHFDDRLGLSIGEQQRYQHEDAVVLPTPEPLLADKEHHIIPRIDDHILNEEYGFKMDVPVHLYNYGEIYNLSIIRGTLNQEERFKINEHVMQSIIMLDSMSFPKNLQRVPEYAGTHHETLDGRGYPRKLNAEQLSVPARIMAIADVFEALTASDRPYKPAKKLSEALAILHRMQQQQHIDADIFEVFLKSGVYQRFAERYLSPEQIDSIDIQQYLA